MKIDEFVSKFMRLTGAPLKMFSKMTFTITIEIIFGKLIFLIEIYFLKNNKISVIIKLGIQKSTREMDVKGEHEYNFHYLPHSWAFQT
jgi:hypothetical protein